MPNSSNLRNALRYLSCYGSLFTHAEYLALLRTDDYNEGCFLKLTASELNLVIFALDCDADPGTVYHEVKLCRQRTAWESAPMESNVPAH